MQPENPKRNSNHIVLLGLALVIVVALTVGLLLWARAKTPVTSYKTLNNYSQADGNGGFSFQKPAEITSTFKQTGPEFELSQNMPSSSTKPYKAYISGAYTTSSIALSSQELLVLNANLITPDNKYYGSIETPLKTFLTDRLPQKWQLKLNHPSAFKNKTITANAWLFTYIDTDPSSKNDPISGELIYAVVGKNYYYFTLNASGSTWTVNKTVWQSVTDSLKLQ